MHADGTGSVAVKMEKRLLPPFNAEPCRNEGFRQRENKRRTVTEGLPNFSAFLYCFLGNKKRAQQGFEISKILYLQHTL